MGEFLKHTQVKDEQGNFVVSPGTSIKLDNLDQTNGFAASGGMNHFLSSIDVTTKNPPWTNGVKPDDNGKTSWVNGAAIILNDKGDGALDAFYFYFYAWNEGHNIYDYDLGTHLGDW